MGYCLLRIGNLLLEKQSRSDECFVDCVEGFWETTIRKRRDASSRQCYSKRRTERLKTPDAKTEQADHELGPTNSRYFSKNPKLALRSQELSGPKSNGSADATGTGSG